VNSGFAMFLSIGVCMLPIGLASMTDDHWDSEGYITIMTEVFEIVFWHHGRNERRSFGYILR
jgi:hypothetical protein